MNDSSPASAVHSAPRQDAFDRLSVTGWPWGVASLIAGMAFSFFVFGYALIYWRNADMDFMVIYSALAMNDGKQQVFFDHTAYLTILSVKYWFKLLHELSLLDAWSLSSMPPASDVAAFDAAMTHAVRAGRVLVFLIAAASVLVFAGLMRAIVSDWRVALLAAQAFAFSGGVAVHSRILRSELVAAMPVIFALMTLIIAGRRASLLRPAVLALAAALCLLGLENKVQAILLIAVLPLVILPFGSAQSASVAFWRDRTAAWPITAVMAIASGAALGIGWPLLLDGFDRTLINAAELRPFLMGRFGLYQLALMMLIGACMIAYAVLWRVSTVETLTSMFAVILGASLALLVLYVAYDERNMVVIANPIEKMLVFADAATTDVANGGGISRLIALLLGDVGSLLARYTFVLQPSARPTVFMIWLIVPGIVVAYRRGERLLALQALMLLLAAAGIDTLGVRRGLKTEYFIFTDPLIILAGALLLDRFAPDLSLAQWTYPAAVTLLLGYLVVGQAEPVKYAFKETGPESICEWNKHYMPLLPLPWCPPQS
ncbi:MAG: hypothetical protein DI543_10890 [Bradyrhizobium icense]|nr:MAG: hypothetical protein DI543_10890 [Bradyrhizobium icense]